MTDESRKDEAEQADGHVLELRRRLLQTVAAVAVGVTVLPSKWTKPIVGTIVVPAHAAVSPASPTPSPSIGASPTPSPSASTVAPSPTPSSSRPVTPTPSPSIGASPTPSPSSAMGLGRR